MGNPRMPAPPAPGSFLVGVLHLSTAREWRGGERQLLLLAEGLAGRGVEVAVGAPAGSPLARRASAAGLPLLELLPAFVHHPANSLRVAAWLRSPPGWLVHTHTSPALDLARVARAVSSRCALVHTRRVAFNLRRSAKYRAAADRYVAVSQAVGTALVRGGLDPARLRVIPSAVDLARIERARPLQATHRPGPTVVHAGAMTREKGQIVLLEAWRKVVAARPEALLLLLGDGPERSRLEAAARRLPDGCVVLVGEVDHVPSWLKAADLYVQPSLAEGMPGAVLEAMACSLPVVATGVGGTPEALEDGVAGRLVTAADPTALASAILELLAEPERAAAMGRRGRERVERRHSAERMVDAYLELYLELASGD